MPAFDFGGNFIGRVGSPSRPDATEWQPYLWPIQFRQSFFGIVRDEFSVARGDRQFDKIIFHTIKRFDLSTNLRTQWFFTKTEMTPSRIKNSTTTSRMKRLRATRFS